MTSALIMLVVLPFIPGAAPLMLVAAIGGFAMAGMFAWQGMYLDAASVVVVALFALLVRELRLRWAYHYRPLLLRRLLRRPF